MKVSNEDALNMTLACDKYADDKGLLGYACAVNGKRLTDACYEYMRRRESIIQQYGDHELDANGNETGKIILDANSEGAKVLKETLEPIKDIEQDIDILKIDSSEVIGKLTGREALELLWMIEDEHGGGND